MGFPGFDQRHQCPRGLRCRGGSLAAQLRVAVGFAGFSPAAVFILMRLHPVHRFANVRLAHVLVHRLQAAQDQPGAVNVVHSPATEPAPVRLLFAADEFQRFLYLGMIAVGVQAAHQPQDVPGDVHRGRIEHGAVVGERNQVEQAVIVVLVERAPAAVLALHAEQPGERAPALFFFPRRVGKRDAVESHQNFRGVVGIGITFIVELEGPAAGWRVGIFDGPIAGPGHLFFKHPFSRFDHGGVVLRQARIHECVESQSRVPQGRNAGLEHQMIAPVDDEPIDRFQSLDDS